MTHTNLRTIIVLLGALASFAGAFTVAYAQAAPASVIAAIAPEKEAKKVERKRHDDSKPAKDETKPAASGPSASLLPPEKAGPIVVPHFDSAPVIDGKLDDDIWKKAVLLRDFYQFQPGDNVAPTAPTEVRIGYDAHFLYFAFHCYDDPLKVRATVARRDQIFSEDNVLIFLDTFNDKRKAYMLSFNPFGVQADGVYTEGSETDMNVDIVMESKGALTDDGYIVEVAVPFKSLRYEAGNGKLWGIHVWRRIARQDNEMDSWVPISRDKVSRLEQEGHLTGLDNLATERALEIIPTITFSETGRRAPVYPLSFTANNPGVVDNGRFVNNPVKADPGISVKLGLTSNITLDFTANPDFAQVEADQPVITANQRFPIFFAEKRPFFLEGIDIFQTPIQAVHTRSIIDPDYAVKLTGKTGRNSFGLLLASDNAPGNFSEEERNDPATRAAIEPFLDKNATVGVLRFKRDVGRESSLGMIATSYNFIEQHNQLAGFDGRFKLDPKTIFSFQALGTTSRHHFYDAALDEDRYRTGNGLGYSWNLDYTGRHFGYTLMGEGRTRDYRADVGFVERTNTNSNGAFFRVSNDPKQNARLVSWRVFGFNFINYDFQGRSQSLTQGIRGNLQFTRQTWVNFGYSRSYERLLEEEFGPQRTFTRAGAFAGDSERSTVGQALSVSVGTNPTKKLEVVGFIGRRWNIFDYDFGAGPRYSRVSPAALLDPSAPLDPGPANGVDMQFGATVKPTSALSLSLNYSRSSLRRNATGRTVFVDNISSFRSTYQFTRFLFARARLDYDSLASSVRGQYLFGWTPNPGTSFYVGYNDDMNYDGFNPYSGLPEPGFRRNSRTFFIKTSYLFRRSI
ncbi:MAG TPA: sugar-binding protein [Blastocatellia bacterium]|nr:sugar-binding protein [Blastocatellia bacterium]